MLANELNNYISHDYIKLTESLRSWVEDEKYSSQASQSNTQIVQYSFEGCRYGTWITFNFLHVCKESRTDKNEYEGSNENDQCFMTGTKEIPRR